MRLAGFLVATAGLLLGTACVSDPKVQDESTSTTGMRQANSDGGSTIGADEACKELVTAAETARTRLGCDAPKTPPTCPAYVSVGGSLPCKEYLKSTVQECAATMAAYASCDEFDVHPCVAAAVTSSCGHVAVPDAGPDGAVKGGGKEAGSPDATSPDAAADAASTPDATPDAHAPVDSGTD
jgi:hypothetical protein